MVGLVREHGTKRTTMGRESPIPLVHILAVSDRGGDGTIRVGRNTRLNAIPVLPTRVVAPVTKRPRSLSILAVYESKDGLFQKARTASSILCGNTVGRRV
jgi:hypothetical protein